MAYRNKGPFKQEVEVERVKRAIILKNEHGYRVTWALDPTDPDENLVMGYYPLSTLERAREVAAQVNAERFPSKK